ncbi:olfactory receptor 1-like [Pseudophryne corroboree]|uniref:olfactory receptor 1-like n=1 Tax=Pseudophryne corroboree TaxID=495146 RepID=UPI003081FC34
MGPLTKQNSELGATINLKTKRMCGMPPKEKDNKAMQIRNNESEVNLDLIVPQAIHTICVFPMFASISFGYSSFFPYYKNIMCFTQMYFFILAVSTEDLLIFIMAYDRYVAICNPLHYHNILNRKNCMLYVSSIWISGFLNSFVVTSSASKMSFCPTNTMHQFFCDPKALINISSAGSEDFYIVIYLEMLIYAFFPTTFISASYIKIMRVILQIKSKDGRQKAFSTCSSHLTIIIIYYTTAMAVYMVPPSEYSNVLEPVLSAVYVVVTPMINPLIYSLRNKDVKRAMLRKIGIKQRTVNFS